MASTRLRAACIALGWAMVAAIAWLSLTPAPPTIDFRESDKVGHFLAYGTLMFWFSKLYVNRGTRILYGIGFVAMGIALELAQRALGTRSYEIFDMFANTLGVLIGWAVALAVRKPLLV